MIATIDLHENSMHLPPYLAVHVHRLDRPRAQWCPYGYKNLHYLSSLGGHRLALQHGGRNAPRAQGEVSRDRPCRATVPQQSLDSALRSHHHQCYLGEAGRRALHATGLESKGCLASRSSAHVTANEVVSEPTNMKVLMLSRISSSEIRCSGERSVAALDIITIHSQNEYDEMADSVKNKRSDSRSPASICFPAELAVLHHPLLLLDELPRYTIDCLSTLTHNICRPIRLVGSQHRMTGQRTSFTNKLFNIGA